MLRLVFMGSPDFAVPSLRAALDAGDVRAVITQPDKPSGRGLALRSPPVAELARDRGIPVLQPPSVRAPGAQAALRELGADLFVVVAYGKILPPEVLSIPRLGCVNVHASLLPKYRGAAPIQWAILRGERETGVSIMQLDAGMDTGPVLLERSLPIADDDTAGTLAPRLAALGAGALIEALARLEAGTVTPRPQDASRATYAPLLDKEDGRIDFTRPAREVHAHIRGVDPWPGAFTTLGGETLRLFRPTFAGEVEAGPGTVAGVDDRGLLVVCGDRRAIGVAELQLPGRKRMAAAALCAGRPIPAGTHLG